jgi:hypothetical protein
MGSSHVCPARDVPAMRDTSSSSDTPAITTATPDLLDKTGRARLLLRRQTWWRWERDCA